MPTWPATLPTLPLVGVQISADDSVLRSQMDAGPPTRRNRFTANTSTISGSLIISGEQVATLDTFFHTTLKNGALAFDWKDPRTGATVSVAFKSPPEYTALAGRPDETKRIWRASLSLEIQP